ncbi:putative ATP-dependent RNA helicase DHX57 [Coccinella septempunctata]|uniref:putative ATP-dependent RNA helicase DHX57 n=1 Tax=Coccinella septempunctata TaxID=41139 RepID=UPI001D076276|nr:putative ATP-dependent RNA helicase DHX57 [Coccinella septempunctata]
MDSESAINTADLLLRQVAEVKISSGAPVKKFPVVKEELQFLHLDEISQEKVLDTLKYVYGQDFKLKDISAYQDVNSNLGKKFWVGQGTLVVKGGCDFSKTVDTAVHETDRLKQFALFRLESYGFHKNHCIEALDYCSGNIEDCLYLLYCKYLNLPYPFSHHSSDCTDEELQEQRTDEKSSLESIYENSFREKVKNSVWILELKLDYLVNLFQKNKEKLPKKILQQKVKKKEKCKFLIRGQCKFGDKCRFSHEVEEDKKDVEVNNIFELEVRFPPNSKYPFEPPLIFIRKNDILPPLVNLKICSRLFEEANSYAKDGIPSVYSITELLQNSEEITEHLKKDCSFLNPKVKLFEEIKAVKTFNQKSSHYRKGLTNKDNKRNYSKDETLLENKNIVERFQTKVDTEEYKVMLSSRRKLPVWNYMNDILNTLESSQVTIISGETGCGKSTQIPQYILDDWIIKFSSESKRNINIICTQPRRISAIGVAERVAQERLEKVGNTVGYQIRLESKTSASTRLMFCTTGILLRRLESDPLMPEVTHIVVDEVHERSEESDFLLMILRDMLSLRPDLKIILMSATLNADLFASYFGSVPIIKVPGRTFPVEQFFLEDIFESIHYVLEEGSEYSRKISKDDDYLESQLESAEVMFTSEKPRNALKDENLTFRQICTRYQGYSKLACKNLFLMDPEKINNDLIEYLLSWIVSGDHDFPKTGTILVFLPGIAEITSLHDQLKDNPDFGSRTKKFLLLPLHSSLTSEEQAAIFIKPKYGVRKIVLSTNLAETSITIDDCVFVIDSGKMKEKHFDPNRNMESLETTWVTRANALQRKGRAGRVMPGVCFHLYTGHRYSHHFLGQPIPEIHRVPLEQLILNIKLLQVFEEKDVKQVLGSFIEPPSEESIDSSISRLQSVGALDKKIELTALGQHLASLPVDVRIGKLLLFGAIFSCIDAALTMAACLSFKSPFLNPFGKRDQANAKKMNFASGFSDQITVYTAYKKWLQVYKKSTAGGRNYANENFLSFRTLISIADIKYQFLELLVDIGFISVDLNKRRKMGEDIIAQVTGQEFNRHCENYRLLSSVICAALYPNVVKVLTPPKSYIMSAAGAIPKEVQAKDLQFATVQEKVFMHPSSINYKLGNFPSPYLVYQEKVRTSKVFFRDCSVIPLMSLVLFTGFDLDIRIHNGSTFISLENGWILLQVEEHQVAEMVKLIRLELFDILEEKIRDPLLNLQHNERSNRIISTILHLISA